MKSPDSGRIKAIAFDVDGTMYANARMYLRSVSWGLRNWRLVRAFRSVRLTIREIRPVENFYALQAQLTGQALGISAEAASRLIQERVYEEWELSLRGIRLEPGLRQTLAAFRDHGLGLGVLSDFPVGRKLPLLGLDGIFDCVLSAEDTGYLKPNPDPFLSLARGLGLDPAEILYVGNSYTYDVLGAHGVGMMTAHFAKKPRKHSLANLTFSNYDDLHDWVLKNS